MKKEKQAVQKDLNALPGATLLTITPATSDRPQIKFNPEVLKNLKT